MKRIKKKTNYSDQINDYKRILTEVYLLNVLNLETCSKVIRKL